MTDSQNAFGSSLLYPMLFVGSTILLLTFQTFYLYSKTNKKANLYTDNASQSTGSPNNTGNFRLRCIIRRILIVLVSILVLATALTIQAGDSFCTMIPNMLLFLGFPHTTVIEYWKRTVDLQHGPTYEMNHIPIIDATDYTYDNLQDATENFLRPAVVRGLFNDTNAVKYWHDAEYLKRKFDNYNVVVVLDGFRNSSLTDKVSTTFWKTVDDIYSSQESTRNLMFPLRSRGASDSREVRQKFHNTVEEELDIDRIRKSFAKRWDYLISQIIIGRGSNDSDVTTGYGWHCEGGQNFNVHVLGRKRTHLMHPRYSKLLWPVRNSAFAIQSGHGDISIKNLMHKLPIEYVDLIPGDMYYIPPFYWHSTFNKPGVSISVPLRPLGFGTMLRSNFQYSMMIVVNTILYSLGIAAGGIVDKGVTRNEKLD